MLVLVRSECRSIAPRHTSEGGGNHTRRAHKTALNMMKKLLSLDLVERGIPVAIVHVRRRPEFRIVSKLIYLKPGSIRTDDEERRVRSIL